MNAGVDSILLAAGLFGAASSGFWACKGLSARIAQSKRKRNLKGSAAQAPGRSGVLLSGGLAAWVMETAMRQTLAAAASGLPDGRFAKRGLPEGLADRMRLAGMMGRISVQGAYQARLLCLITFGAVSSVFGMMLSVQLAVIGALAGMAFGWWAIWWALSKEAQARRQSLEAHLSEAVEVICLGLRSGLSFDYALQMYCGHFDTILSRELSLARSEWMAGLKPRDQALRDVASGYESAIFLRVVESIIRAMRFGSPLADALESLAVEARQAHKADVEEKVMKAPVKMMLPVGTLILPSMLILVLGPVLLDLVKGF